MGLATYRLNGAVATIAMDDGKVNALASPMLDELNAALDRAEADAMVVVLTGRAGVFSAGFDLRCSWAVVPTRWRCSGADSSSRIDFSPSRSRF